LGTVAITFCITQCSVYTTLLCNVIKRNWDERVGGRGKEEKEELETPLFHWSRLVIHEHVMPMLLSCLAKIMTQIIFFWTDKKLVPSHILPFSNRRHSKLNNTIFFAKYYASVTTFMHVQVAHTMH
jgi:hypothetical protein